MASKKVWQPIRITHDVYLSGPLSSYGTYDNNVQTFKEAAKALRKRGYRVFNPVEGEPVGLPWTSYLRRDLAALVACKFVVTLPHWQRSKGARLEVSIARRLSMPIIPIEKAREMRAR